MAQCGTILAMQLDIESLRALLAVLDHGGMTAAAKRLNMGQSAVSRKIQRLEDRVGRPLLIRDGHTLRPTRDGRALLADARQMVELHDRSVARLNTSDLTGMVKLSCNGEVDTAQVASLLGTFKCQHPGAQVEFRLDHSGNLIDWVDTGEIDVAVFQLIADQVRPTDIVLWTEQIHWATSITAPFADGAVPLIDFGDHCYYNEFTLGILERGGIDHDVVFSAASSIDVCSAVRAGIGIAVLSDRYITDDIVYWKPPTELEALPKVSQVIRIVPGERPDAVAALVETIQAELTQGRVAA